MRLLLDTHAFLWWMFADPRLPEIARRAIAVESDATFVSAATVWEIATKHRIGKLDVAAELVSDMEGAIAGQNFLGLPVSLAHAQRAGALPGPHADPFDRMLIAQAMTEDLTLVSNERPFDLYGVKRLW